MRFELVDAVLERSPERVVALKQVSRAEEYLGDHFPGFPILPGVLMLEVLVQAARELLLPHSPLRMVLGEARAVKYGQLVRPGDRLIVEVSLIGGADESGAFAVRGAGKVDRTGAASSETAVSGRLTMRPLRVRPRACFEH